MADNGSPLRQPPEGCIRHTDRADGLELVAELQAKAANIQVDDESWKRIQHAKYRTGLRVGAIINVIREGSLLAGCRPDIHD